MKKFLTRLFDYLFPQRPTERLIQNHTGIIPTEVQELQGTPRTISILPYHTEIVRALILETKFHDNEQAARMLGGILADYLIGFLEEDLAFSNAPIILIPLPLSRKRHAKRGYNQTERICREAVRVVGNSLQLDTHFLIRIRDTLPQTSLDKSARLTNMQGAFATTKTPVSAYTYIVVDDVATTGATLRAAYTALAEAGAKKIYTMALAH